MDRGIVAWFGLMEARFAAIIWTHEYFDSEGRAIDLRKI